jgi:competence protein ComEA
VEKISLFLREFGILVVVGVIGMGVLMYGLWGQLAPEQATVEIIRDDSNEKTQLIFVDVAGAVEKPGVYSLPGQSRIGDALVVAGGLSAEADRGWVAKTINLAAVVEDGDKIFIPKKDEDKTANQSVEYRESQARVNINTASLSELDGLEGIGEVRAKTILDNRPYSKIDDLVSKAKIPESVYEKIKNQISVY